MLNFSLSYNMPSQNEPLLGDLESTTAWYSEIGFVEVLDFLIIAAVLIPLLIHLMRRRAGKMIVGGLFVAILLGVCILIGFPILSAFAEGVFSASLLVLLVLFHDELRDVLRTIGCFPEKLASLLRRRGSRGSAAVRNEKVIKEVCEAVEHMAASRTGALIVLKRASGLREYTIKGKILNAEVSSGLIRTVFFNGCPLHDGAMIIENGKIRATSCQLPPADPEGLDESLGERHKAAIGISECTDAVAIIVSEETGTISVALGDELKRGYSAAELKEELTNLLNNYTTKLENWDSKSSITMTSVRKQKKPAKEKKHSTSEDGEA